MIRPGAFIAAAFASAVLAAGCGSDDNDDPVASTTTGTTTTSDADELDEVVQIDGNRGLYVRCTGSGSPTVVMEGGDLDTSDSYYFAEEAIAEETRVCVYDRANLGQSDPAPGPRGLEELVSDFEGLLESAPIPGPYVLVGTSGGGYISAGYAVEHPDEVAGMVFVEVPAPFKNPPAPIVKETDPSHPGNVEKRDFLQVEKDAWAARQEIGDIPITVISNRYSEAEIAGAAFPSEASGMRANVEEQKGWLVLSPRAEQVVVTTGHAVEEADPQFVIDAILDVVKAARAEQATTAKADPLVGEWVAVNRCDEFVDAMTDAGLEAFTTEMAAGLRDVPPGKIDPADPCKGAKPVEHSHSFSEAGEFASFDENGEQVDEGTYEVTDEGVFTLRRPPFESDVRYRVEGDTATFDLVVPNCDARDCRTGAALGIATFFPRTYERVG